MSRMVTDADARKYPLKHYKGYEQCDSDEKVSYPFVRDIVKPTEKVWRLMQDMMLTPDESSDLWGLSVEGYPYRSFESRWLNVDEIIDYENGLHTSFSMDHYNFYHIPAFRMSLSREVPTSRSILNDRYHIYGFLGGNPNSDSQKGRTHRDPLVMEAHELYRNVKGIGFGTRDTSLMRHFISIELHQKAAESLHIYLSEKDLGTPEFLSISPVSGGYSVLDIIETEFPFPLDPKLLFDNPNREYQYELYRKIVRKILFNEVT